MPRARRTRRTLLGLAVAFLCSRYAAAQDAPREFEGTLFRGVSLGVAPLRTTRFDRAAISPRLLSGGPTKTSPTPAAEPSVPPRKRFWTAAGEMVLLEALPAIYNRYVAHEPFAYISWHTVSENFKAGFGYDSDHFSINQSSHPLHGSLYFNAARSNGYDYWESALFTAAGSVVWELTMENTRPSVNDLVNTTLGGMTRGEVSHRLAAVIRDNMASGSDRFWRELGAAVLDPVGAFSRLVHGEMTNDFPNPEERYPDGFSVTSDVGYRHVNGATDDANQALVSLSARYGDPFTGDIQKPFDSFWAGIDLNFPGGQAISRIEERGVLKGWELTDRTASARHIVGFSQEYEYFNNAAQVFGAQTLSAGILSRWALNRSLFAVTDFSVLAIPLAGIQTTNFTNPETGRNYDYAPGGGLRAAARIFGGSAELLSVGYGVVWAHTVDGASDSNTLQFFRANARIPIYGALAGGAGYSWYSRRTTYTGFLAQHLTQSEWRAFLSLTFGRSGLRKPKV